MDVGSNPVRASAGEKYTVRRKVFKVFGASFHVYGPDGAVVGYCRQKAFRLREDIRLYTGPDMREELLRLNARNIIDFSATYDVSLPSGERLGSLRRKGMRSSFVRDSWRVFDENDNQAATITETGSIAALRRYVDIVAFFSPQRYEVTRTSDGAVLARFRQHFNPWIFRLGVSIEADDPVLDELVILGAACLIAAIEGREYRR